MSLVSIDQFISCTDQSLDQAVSSTFREFDQSQEKNTKEIIKKILKENENLANKKKLYPVLFNTEKHVKPTALDPIEKLKIPSDKSRRGGVRKKPMDQARLAQLLNPDEYAEGNNLSDDAVNELIEQRSLMESTTIASKEENDEDEDDEIYGDQGGADSKPLVHLLLAKCRS